MEIESDAVGEALSCRDPQRFVYGGICFLQSTQKYPARFAVMQSVGWRATGAQPEMLYGVGVGRIFAARIRLVKTEKSTLAVIQGDAAIRVGTGSEHERPD